MPPLHQALEDIPYPANILERTGLIHIREDSELQVAVSISLGPLEVRIWAQYTDENGIKHYGYEQIKRERGEEIQEVVDYAIIRAQAYTRESIPFYSMTDTPPSIRIPKKR